MIHNLFSYIIVIIINYKLSTIIIIISFLDSIITVNISFGFIIKIRTYFQRIPKMCFVRV